MPIEFKWSGKTIQGTVQNGVMAANSKEEVMAFLKKKKITPTVIAEKNKSQSGAFASLKRGRAKVSTKDLVIFTRQFATMIDAGLPLVQALEILSQQTENKGFGRIIGEIKVDIEGGSTYADALKKHSKIFDN